MNLRLVALPALILVAILVAAIAGQPPELRTLQSPTEVSIDRLKNTVATVARTPHPAGSAANAKVRDFLFAELSGIGLAVEVQRGFGARQWTRFGGAITAAPVENIIAVLPGSNRTEPAVGLMAHYDSVPFAPGAGDDAAGTAAVIETARILAEGPKPARDVVFIITDAEEAGLLGADVFFRTHPLSRRIGTVVNVEGRGSSGRAQMFQTSPGNAELVDLWARHAISPSGNSLADAIYRLLPNDTDLTVAFDTGKTGINAGFLDDQFDYHSPTDSAANLDPRTLQHLADFALTTTRALAMAERLPSGTADSVFFDVLGLGVVRYPAIAGWLLIAAAAIGLATLRMARFGTSWGKVLVAVPGIVLLTAAVGAACHFLPLALYDEGAIAGREKLAEIANAFWVYAGVTAGLLMLYRPRAASWIATLFLLLIMAVAAQILMPAGAYLFAWPLVIAVAIAHVSQRWGSEAPGTLLVCALAGGAVLAILLQFAHLAFISTGDMSPGGIAIVVPLGLALVWPLLAPWTASQAARAAGGVMILAAAAGVVWLAIDDGLSARHPRPTDRFHLTDVSSGQSWWATTSGPSELPPGPAKLHDLAPLRSVPVWTTPAPSMPVERPEFIFERNSAAAALRMRSRAQLTAFVVALRPAAPLVNATLNGVPVDLPAKEWTLIRYRIASPPDLMLRFDTAAPASIDIRYLAANPGLPSGTSLPSGQSSNWALLSGTRTLTGAQRIEWR